MSRIKLVILLLPILLPGLLAAQNSKIALMGGASIPDLFHAGTGIYLYENVALNFKLGTAFHGKYGFWGTYSLGSDLSFYFGRESKKQGAKQWAFNSGITYLKDESAGNIWRYIYSDSSVSYDLYVSRNVVFQPELGILFQLSKKVEEKPEYEPGWFGYLDVDLPVLPVVGARFKIFL